MRTISGHFDSEWYQFPTDGNMLPTISKHMAKICLFLQNKTDIFSSYLPKSDTSLAQCKCTWQEIHGSGPLPSGTSSVSIPWSISFNSPLQVQAFKQGLKFKTLGGDGDILKSVEFVTEPRKAPVSGYHSFKGKLPALGDRHAMEMDIFMKPRTHFHT